MTLSALALPCSVLDRLSVILYNVQPLCQIESKVEVKVTVSPAIAGGNYTLCPPPPSDVGPVNVIY